MEHLFPTECLRFVPNPFVLVHVAARRARQLRAGEPPRVVAERTRSAPLRALSEIAAGAFADEELQALLDVSGAAENRDAPDRIEHMAADEAGLLDGMKALAAVPPPSSREENYPNDLA